jgi:hypothetical protein
VSGQIRVASPKIWRKVDLGFPKLQLLEIPQNQRRNPFESLAKTALDLDLLGKNPGMVCRPQSGEKAANPMKRSGPVTKLTPQGSRSPYAIGQHLDPLRRTAISARPWQEKAGGNSNAMARVD